MRVRPRPSGVVSLPGDYGHAYVFEEISLIEPLAHSGGQFLERCATMAPRLEEFEDLARKLLGLEVIGKLPQSLPPIENRVEGVGGRARMMSARQRVALLAYAVGSGRIIGNDFHLFQKRLLDAWQVPSH